jgi:dihydroxyacetone kinase
LGIEGLIGLSLTFSAAQNSSTGQQPTTGRQAQVATNDPEVGQSHPNAAGCVFADAILIVDRKDTAAAPNSKGTDLVTTYSNE